MRLAVVFPMVGVGGVKNLAATRELRVELFTARHMGVVDDVNFLVVQRVQKAALIIVLPMVVGGDAVMRVALELPEENQDSVSGMVVARGVREKTVQRVQRACLGFAFHMEVVADANL